MDQDVSDYPSKVPQHLRPFLRPSFTTEPVVTKESTLALQSSPPQSVELCPPHWRLPPKRSLRSTLRDILLKEWPRPTPKTPHRSVSYDQPLMMRMKDSDDYITARAANPRTGLISPSVGTLTPRLQDTPGSPGEALYLKTKDLPPSPTPDAKGRPVLTRANERRKVSSGSNKLWKADEYGWLTEIAAASPRVTTAEVEGGLVSSRSQQILNDDALVVHMPSAQEPQPYAYPGYSAKQIEAAEFYKCKARRVSSEGYDQRMFHGHRQSSSEPRPGISGIRKVSSSKPCHNAVRNKIVHSGEPNRLVTQEGHITVAKRRVSPQEFRDADVPKDCRGGAELYASTFAPFSSRKTPLVRVSDEGITEMHTSKATRHNTNPTEYHIHRKAPGADGEHHIRSGNDLKDLPRIALVHPALAALPKSHPHRQYVEREEVRKCSFGCARDADGNVCIERRTPSTSTTSTTKFSLFEQSMPASPPISIPQQRQQPDLRNDTQDTPQPLDILAAAIVTIIDACRNTIAPVIPRIGFIDVLRAADSTPQQKVDALKSVLIIAGQTMLLLAITATLWHVGSAAIQVVEVVFWPVILPFKVLKWLGGRAG